MAPRAATLLLVLGTSAAAAAQAIAPFSIARLNVETLVSGEPVVVELGADGVVAVRVAPEATGKPVARIVGASIVATDGRVLASRDASVRVRVRRNAVGSPTLRDCSFAPTTARRPRSTPAERSG